jgi:hypothetical protein
MPSSVALDTGIRLSASSADVAEFGRTMRTAATVETENLFTMLLSKTNRDDMASPASMLFGLKPGNLSFGQVIALGDNPTTHWVSFQAESVGALLQAVDAFMKTQDFAAYAKNADDFREVTTRSVSRQIMTLTP